MKLASQISRDGLKAMQSTKPILCDYLIGPDGYVALSQPILSTEYQCTWCGGTEHHCPLYDPSLSAARIWLCGNLHCEVHKQKSKHAATTILPIRKRSVEWVKFCEINGIGDINYGVKFENIEQTQAKVSYMLKFASTPLGILHMQGEPGTGKTYAAMAICELFTRTSTSCVFTTQKQMSNNWLETFNKERVSNYIEKVTTCNLLVIDDFGTGDIAPGFMAFFMDLINSRLQWSNRGTIITTNLNENDFGDYCGNALTDRINTGQSMVFKGGSRRKQIIL